MIKFLINTFIIYGFAILTAAPDPGYKDPEGRFDAFSKALRPSMEYRVHRAGFSG
jgi:hypothetical protein